MVDDVNDTLAYRHELTGQKREKLFRGTWLQYALGEGEYLGARELTVPVLRELYPGVWRCGPDYFRMRAFDVLLLNALDTVADSHQAVQLMNRLHGTYAKVSDMMEGVPEDEFDMLTSYLLDSQVARRVETEAFFDVYASPDVFLQTYRRAANLILLRHVKADERRAKPLFAAHERMVANLEERVQASGSVPRSRALMRSVTGTAFDA